MYTVHACLCVCMIFIRSDLRLADSLYMIMMHTSSLLMCVLHCVWQRQQQDMERENKELQVREWSHCSSL